MVNDLVMNGVRLLLGLICCFGLPVLLAGMLGFLTETHSKVSVVVRCKERHPRYGRCALGSHHQLRGGGVMHRGRYGGSWLR